MSMISKFPRYGINNTFRFDNRVFLGKGEQMKPFSVEFIFRVDSFNSYVPIIWSTATNNNTYLAYHVPGKYFYNPTRNGAASEDTRFPFDIKLGKTYHMVYVIDETGGKMYIDGVFVAQNGNKSYIWNHLIDGSELFSASADKTEGWTGNIYSFRVFNYPMDLSMAKSLYNNAHPFRVDLKSQKNPAGILPDATVENISRGWDSVFTRNPDGSVTFTNGTGTVGGYLGGKIEPEYMNGMLSEDYNTFRVTMTYSSNNIVKVRDLNTTRMNAAEFPNTDNQKVTMSKIIQYSANNPGSGMRLYIAIQPAMEGNTFTVYDIRVEQVGMLSEVLGKNMTTNMVRDTANVAETGGVKEVIPAQHLIGLSVSEEDSEVLFNGPITEIRHNIEEGKGNVEKQPDGGWLVNITEPNSSSSDSRPIIRLVFTPAIDIQPHDTIRVTILAEPTTGAADRKQISQVFFVAGNQTIKMPFYTNDTEVSGNQFNDSVRSYRDDIALYFISSNAPFSAHFLSMKVERLKKVNNIRLVYENPYNPVYVRTFNGAAVNNGDATEIVNNQDGTFTISQTGKDSQGRSTYVLHSFTAIPTTAGKEYDVTLQWTSPDIAKTLTRIMVLSGISFPIQLTGDKNSVTARITAIQSSISSLSVYPEDNDTPLEFTIKNITVKEVL